MTNQEAIKTIEKVLSDETHPEHYVLLKKVVKVHFDRVECQPLLVDAVLKCIDKNIEEE